jgi:DNA-binding beta-propeller fold protein YncE
VKAARISLLFSLSALTVAATAHANDTENVYSIAGHIAGGTGGAWDYAVIDASSGKMFLAQAGVTSLDLKTKAITTGLVHAGMSHGVAILGNGVLAVDDSKSKEITVFDGADGSILSTIPTAKDNPVSGMHALDALVLEPHTGLLVAVNGESGLLLLIDVHQARVLGTIAVGGHPEFAVADGSGKLFINVNQGRKSEIVEVDVASREVVRRLAVPGCQGATGLAYEGSAKLLMAACDNGFFKVLAGDSGQLLASIVVGGGADAVIWDGRRRRALIASGDSGTLSVIAVRSASDIALVQVLPTRVGTRLGAVDIESGILYLPAAKFGPPKPPIPFPSVVPGSFEILMVVPN